MQAQIIFPAEQKTQPKVNPVYNQFKQMALNLIRSGFKSYSAKSIIEVIRWHKDIQEGPGNEFAINNNNTALYARMFINEFPEYDGFFRLRKSQYDDLLQ